MLRDRDVTGLLHTLERSQKYDHEKFLIARLLQIVIHPHRSAIFMSHVPWLGSIILSHPLLVPDYKTFRSHSQERGMRRIKEGSTYKDLFYHLVRYIFHLQDKSPSRLTNRLD